MAAHKEFNEFPHTNGPRRRARANVLLTLRFHLFSLSYLPRALRDSVSGARGLPVFFALTLILALADAASAGVENAPTLRVTVVDWEETKAMLATQLESRELDLYRSGQPVPALTEQFSVRRLFSEMTASQQEGGQRDAGFYRTDSLKGRDMIRGLISGEGASRCLARVVREADSVLRSEEFNEAMLEYMQSQYRSAGILHGPALGEAVEQFSAAREQYRAVVAAVRSNNPQSIVNPDLMDLLAQVEAIETGDYYALVHTYVPLMPLYLLQVDSENQLLVKAPDWDPRVGKGERLDSIPIELPARHQSALLGDSEVAAADFDSDRCRLPSDFFRSSLRSVQAQLRARRDRLVELTEKMKTIVPRTILPNLPRIYDSFDPSRLGGNSWAREPKIIPAGYATDGDEAAADLDRAI